MLTASKEDIDPTEYYGLNVSGPLLSNSQVGSVHVREPLGEGGSGRAGEAGMAGASPEMQGRQQLGGAALGDFNATPNFGEAYADTDLSRSADVTGGDNNDEDDVQNDQSHNRRSRISAHQGPTFSDYAGVEALTACPAVVKVKDGQFLELRCSICGGNSSWVHGTYNKGVRGFQSHFRQVHDLKKDAETVLEQCTHRVVPEEEAERIMSGEEMVDAIPCQQKNNIGRNVEYVGNASTERKPSKKRGSNAGGNPLTATGDAGATTSEPDHTSTPVPAKKRRRAKPASNDNAGDGNNAGENDHDGSAPTTTESTTKRSRDISVESHPKCKVYLENGMADDGKTKKYVELRCELCGGNGSFGSGKFVDGIKGFKLHFQQIHKVKRTTADVMRFCFYRDIPQAEIKELEKPDGKPTVGFIRCEGSPNVRPKESYKGFDSAPRT